MKSLVLLLFFLSIHQLTSAQFGLTGQFVSGRVSHEETNDLSSKTVDQSASGYYLGANYWLRLKNVRLEFFPELGFSRLNTNEADVQGTSVSKWSLTIPASFYLLEFKGDCHCPTFSKQNDLFKKGFFLQLITSLEHEKANLDTTMEKWHQNLGLGIGTGLDIGISDFLTITPLIQYLKTVVTTKDAAQPGTSSALKAGIRIIFRPDYH
ncbi:MAG: hypothetical protein KDC53_05800 [Saprospiraceae bacterium]|nr:hypothetical protein [Saprospiraceae bacterium]